MLENLEGQIFDKLIVIDKSDKKDKRGVSLWYCLCECGNFRYATGSQLKRGLKKSCGCGKKRRNGFIDLTGKRFGRWTVLEQIPGQKKTTWRTVCDCGNFGSVSGTCLRSGGSKSCGCLRKEINGRKNHERLN